MIAVFCNKSGHCIFQNIEKVSIIHPDAGRIFEEDHSPGRMYLKTAGVVFGAFPPEPMMILHLAVAE